ncbi:MAG: CinA family protein [Actinobacteria bacterium]|nr:CinA family protein [Actinomycetota bacterium]
MIAQSVVKKLTKQKATLSVAESITGGGLASAITEVAGSSKVFMGGVIAYDDEVKVKELSVDKKSLGKFTAVSEEVAKEMAVGALKKFKTDYAIATTGVAGPGKAYGQKAGTIWVAIASKKEVFAVGLSLSGSRDLIRHATIESALASFERILRP